MTIRLLLPVTEVVLPLDWLPEEAVVVAPLEPLSDLLVPELTKLPPVVDPLLPPVEPETRFPLLLPLFDEAVVVLPADVLELVLPVVAEFVLPEVLLLPVLALLRLLLPVESVAVVLTLRDVLA